jgi:hypothetical protein
MSDIEETIAKARRTSAQLTELVAQARETSRRFQDLWQKSEAARQQAEAYIQSGQVTAEDREQARRELAEQGLAELVSSEMPGQISPNPAISARIRPNKLI